MLAVTNTSIYALNAVNGHPIWGGKGGSGDPIISSPSVVDSVVYYGGSGQLVGLQSKAASSSLMPHQPLTYMVLSLIRPLQF